MYKLMKNLDEKEFYLKTKKTQKNLNSLKSSSGVTLVALVITILFPYDEKLKCSNSKGFLLTTI